MREDECPAVNKKPVMLGDTLLLQMEVPFMYQGPPYLACVASQNVGCDQFRRGNVSLQVLCIRQLYEYILAEQSSGGQEIIALPK